MKHIVVVGGGAGGLELATKLGHKLGKKGKANISLVDKSSFHIWKPLLHEIASGSLDVGTDSVDYGSHGVRHHFNFIQGEMIHIAPDKNTISLAALYDENNEVLIKERSISFDMLVIAIGSVSNDFNTQGVAENCYFLDSTRQANRFHRALMNRFIRANQNDSKRHLKISIVGGGATGVELSAELYHVAEIAHRYGLSKINKDTIQISLIEAGETILAALPAKVSMKSKKYLQKLGVEILENTKIKAANEKGFLTANDELIEADMMLWAAGVKVADYIKEMNVFELNKLQQIITAPNLKVEGFDNIYAIGDCCGFQQKSGKWVPPRAQSAHQMASTVAKNIVLEITKPEKPLTDFAYKDYGSLVNLSNYSTVGSLMGRLASAGLFLEGKIARFVYISLYRMHQISIHGKIKGVLVILIEKLNRVIKPKLKVH